MESSSSMKMMAGEFFSALGAMESSSSMKMMAGEFFSASSKAFLRLLSLSPASLLMISGPLMRKKKAPVSFATARAIRVLPVPGGPKSRMPQWKLHHLLECGKLLPATSDVVVADSVQGILLVLSLDRLSLAMDHSIRGNNAVWRGVSLNHLELNSPHASPDDEVVPLVDWPVCLKEVWLQVHLKPVPCKALHTVVDGQDMDPLAVLHVRAALDCNDVA